MRSISQPSISIPLSVSPTGSVPSEIDGDDSSCHGFLYVASLFVPSALFILYLGFQANKNLKKIWYGRSTVMIAYYLLLWFSALLNLAWSSFQSWQCVPGKKIGWNLLSLSTSSGMLYLEISLMAFLLKENYAAGLKTFGCSFAVSGLIVGADVLLKAVFVFGFGVPMFIDVESENQGKWPLWFVYYLLLASVYGYMLIVHFSKWSEVFPPRPSFYNYIIVMFTVSTMALFACALSWFGAGFGHWWYKFINLCCHSLYHPFSYVTFLADVFQEEDLLLDNAYFAEMKDAGFFDTDWENS